MQNKYPQNTSQSKERHIAVTLYLWFLIILNVFTACVYFISGIFLAKKAPLDLTQPEYISIGILGLFNVACTYFLFRWKKWAFVGFILSALIMGCININTGHNPIKSFSGLLGVALLYGILQIKKEGTSAWKQLK